jgi:GNAT superfamily N-acetyltransferase
MKGVTVFRANPSNTIDVFPLFEQAAKEGVFPNAPSRLQLKDFYFRLLNELSSPHHFYYLARRGRGFLGVLHAIAIPGRWDGRVDTLHIELLFTEKEKNRKMGVGKKLLDQLAKDAEEIGIKNFEFLTKDELVEYWCKKRRAVKVSNLMRVVT